MKTKQIITSSVLLSTPILLSAQSKKLPEKPNIIVIYADDMGYGDVSYMGSKDIHTPNIDALAQGGVYFPQGYTTASVSGPSRAGMMTGVYQQRFAYYGNSLKCKVPQSQTMFAEYMKENGYATGMMGKWHLGETDAEAPEARGFDYFYGMRNGSHDYYRSTTDTQSKNYDLRPIYRNSRIQPPLEDTGGYLTDILSDEAELFIHKNANKPFYLYLSFNAVHYPWQVPQHYVDRLDKLNVHHEDRRVFAAMALAMDDGIGRVMQALRENGIEENTLIFFVSDNGSPRGQGIEVPNTEQRKDRGATTMSSPGNLRGFKGDTYEGGIRVPFLAYWKGTIPGGTVYPHPVITLDLIPTALSAIGGKKETNAQSIALDGVNLLPYILGEKPADECPHKILYWRRDMDYAIRQGDWKLTYNDQGSTHRIQLFNLAEDKEEYYDLSDKYPQRAQELQNAFDLWESSLPDFVHRPNPKNRNTKYNEGIIKNVKTYNDNINKRAYNRIEYKK